MISVCMATYNGARYVKKQLESIRTQQKPVDEVIICDDRSTDDTVKICETFIAEYGLENWRVYVNETNLGFCLNFFSAIEKAQGDVIFLSDQDDVWHADKTRVMCDCFEKHPELTVLSSRYDVIDGDDKKIENAGIPYLGDVFDGSLSVVSVDSLIGCSYIRGFATAFRAECKPYLKAIDLKSMMAHDWLINMIGALIGQSAVLNTKLVYYRFHGDNVSLSDMNRTTFLGDRQKRQRGLQESIEGHTYLVSGAFSVAPKDKKAIKAMIRFEKRRLHFLQSKNLFLFVGLLFYLRCYRRYYKSIKGAFRVWLGDFCYAFGINFKK